MEKDITGGGSFELCSSWRKKVKPSQLSGYLEVIEQRKHKRGNMGISISRSITLREDHKPVVHMSATGVNQKVVITSRIIGCLDEGHKQKVAKWELNAQLKEHEVVKEENLIEVPMNFGNITYEANPTAGTGGKVIIKSDGTKLVEVVFDNEEGANGMVYSMNRMTEHIAAVFQRMSVEFMTDESDKEEGNSGTENENVPEEEA